MTNPVFGLRLNPRQARAWRRLGHDASRRLIAPAGFCVQCGTASSAPASRNGWFCFPCQDALDQLNLLPDSVSHILLAEKRKLLVEIHMLRARLQSQETLHSSETQLSLFPDPSL